MGQLPEQQLTKWQAKADELRPKRDETQQLLDQQYIAEESLLDQGKQAAREKNLHRQQRLAARLAECRQTIRTTTTLHQIYNRQLAIIESCIHNATIIQTSNAVNLPGAEELSQGFIQSELILEELNDIASLTSQMTLCDDIPTNEEKSILAEFDSLGISNSVRTDFTSISEYTIEQPGAAQE
jgi:hypothetical protein